MVWQTSHVSRCAAYKHFLFFFWETKETKIALLHNHRLLNTSTVIIPPSLFPQSAESIYWKAWLQQFTGKKLGGTSITPHKLLGKLAVDTKGTVHWMYLSTKGKENLAGVHSMLTQADLTHLLSNVCVQLFAKAVRCWFIKIVTRSTTKLFMGCDWMQ